jgi:hypothetical protein
MKMKAVILPLLLSISAACHSVEVPKRVFVKAGCPGPVSSTVLASFREAVRASSGYQLTTSLADDGGIGAVLTIYMVCTDIADDQNSDIAAVAAIYGQGRCVLGSCHTNSFESTLKSLLCGSKTATECGKLLFRNFDDYWSGPNSPPLKLQ